MKILLDIPNDVASHIEFLIINGRENRPSKRILRNLFKETIIRCLDEDVIEIAVQETIDLEMI